MTPFLGKRDWCDRRLRVRLAPPEFNKRRSMAIKSALSMKKKDADTIS
jgi:hypothetical protein